MPDDYVQKLDFTVDVQPDTTAKDDAAARADSIAEAQELAQARADSIAQAQLLAADSVAQADTMQTLWPMAPVSMAIIPDA